MSNPYEILIRSQGGKRTLGRPWFRWKNNIKMDLKEIGCDGLD
jgi:hypothetical protein